MSESRYPDGIDPDGIDEDFIPRFRDEVAAVELDGEAVLLDGATGAVHTLNPTATLVWKFCDGASSVGELITDLVAVFDEDDPEAIRADVLSLVKDLGRQGLLEDVRAERAPTESDHSDHPHDHGHDHGGLTSEDVDVNE